MNDQKKIFNYRGTTAGNNKKMPQESNASLCALVVRLLCIMTGKEQRGRV